MDVIRPSRRELLKLGGAGAALALVGAAPATPWQRAAWITRTVRPPVIPARRFDITTFGARGDGTSKNTAAIARAIDACDAAGGGRIIVPPGRFLTGAIQLKSHVELHLMASATLAFSTDPADYPLVPTRWEGVELINYSPLLYAYQAHDIAITGQGTLDGQASAQTWWSWKGPWHGTVDGGWRPGMPDQRPARARLFDMGARGVPVAQRVFGDGSYLRPAFIEPYRCENVLIEGVRVRGAPFWQVHPVLCRNVIVRDVDILGHGPNNDGCDPESVDLMLIERCTFDTGDDCIAIKSGRDNDGRRIATPSRDIVIRDCRMKEGHGGITIGSEIAGGVHHVFGERCRMDSPHLDYALRFKNNAMRGGGLNDFHYRDITVGQVARAAIACDFHYEEAGNGPFHPTLDTIRVERMVATGAARVLDSQGLPGAPVGDITLSDCRFDGVRAPSIIRDTRRVTLDRVRVNGRPVSSLV